MGCRAQGDCLSFPERGHSRGEACIYLCVYILSAHALVKGGCLAQDTQLQGLSQGCLYRRWLASPAWPVPPLRALSTDGGWGSNVQAPSGSGMLLLNRAGNGHLLGDQNNTLTADEQVVLLSLFTLRSRGWHSSAAEGRGLRKLSLTFPFVLQITFGVNQNDVTVHLPGHQFTFPNRLNLSVFDYLDIQGDFTLQSLSWE